MEGLVGILKNFLSPYVVTYILAIMAIPFVTPFITERWEKRKRKKRKAAGLDEHIVRNAGDGLEELKSRSLTETGFALAVILLFPCALLAFIHFTQLGDVDAEMERVNIAFVALLLWTLVSGTDIAKNFLGGLAFRSLVAFSSPIQVGDRVTLEGHHGKVLRIGIFYTQLQTPDDDLISIPSSSLVSAVLSSTNAGARSSLCKIPFYICSQNSTEQIQAAEDAIWNAVQGSLYYDFGHPLKIFVTQDPDALVLTAKCYVTSTYEEPEFVSRVTKRVIESFKELNIALPERK